MTQPELELPLEESQVLAALRQAVEDWGGGFGDDKESLEFAVPTRAGIRQGYARFRPEIEAVAGGTRLRLVLEDQVLRVNRSAAIVLLMGALGGIVTMLWALHPSLLALAPIGAALALLAWLMVASRYRSHGPEELLASVAEIAEGSDGES